MTTACEVTFHCAEATVKNWSGEDWVGGAPTVTMAPGTLAAWPALREPHDRVHFAGTETATQWIGWVVMMMIIMIIIMMMMMTIIMTIIMMMMMTQIVDRVA